MIMYKSTNRNKKDGAEMTYAEYQEYMRNFFEQYYQKLSQEEIEAGSGYDFGWGNQEIGKRNRS